MSINCLFVQDRYSEIVKYPFNYQLTILMLKDHYKAGGGPQHDKIVVYKVFLNVIGKVFPASLFQNL